MNTIFRDFDNFRPKKIWRVAQKPINVLKKVTVVLSKKRQFLAKYFCENIYLIGPSIWRISREKMLFSNRYLSTYIDVDPPFLNYFGVGNRVLKRFSPRQEVSHLVMYFYPLENVNQTVSVLVLIVILLYKTSHLG
jgi:hypothetical protein